MIWYLLSSTQDKVSNSPGHMLCTCHCEKEPRLYALEFDNKYSRPGVKQPRSYALLFVNKYSRKGVKQPSKQLRSYCVHADFTD